RTRAAEYAPPPRQLDFAKIETVHPRSYNDARRIGEEYRDGIPVIMNLGDLDDNDAKRIIDFAAGLVFGCRGSIERITNKVFLLSPVNVDVGDQARQQLAQDGFFNQS
ncbi:MAG: cell division protein SepF, partial [Candidatus Nanopelagicales bacterium]|nr:cell division protein SepF [Candidatus Nanopelagicales bacterium]